MMFTRPRIKGEFGRNVAAMMTGTIVAQALPIALSPILTRLYTPQDFGVLAIFMAMNAIVSVVAAGRYDTAIMLPEDDEDALNIVAISMAITLAVSALSALAIFLLHDPILALLGSPATGPWLYLLPAGVLLTCSYQVLTSWNNRNKRFKELAMSRALQGGSAGISQCGLGYLARGTAGGLILGWFAGQLLAIFSLGKANLPQLMLGRSSISATRIKENAIRYKRFPLFSTWGSLFDSGATQMPLFIITSYFSSVITGLFSFTLKVLSLPLFLISSSIAQVLYQKITQLHNEDPAKLRPYILRIAAVLSAIAVPFVIFFMIFGVDIFTFVFGKNWALAGEFAGILSVAAGVRFIVSPLSVVLYLNHNVKAGVQWQVGYFCSLTAVLLLCAHLPIGQFLNVFVGHEVVLFAIYFYVIVKAARQRPGTAAGLAMPEVGDESLMKRPLR
jgi:O-antigen/teichoic acid export membrane protein